MILRPCVQGRTDEQTPFQTVPGIGPDISWHGLRHDPKILVDRDHKSLQVISFLVKQVISAAANHLQKPVFVSS